MRILIAGLLLATSLSAQAQSSIIAIHEETANGLVRVDQAGVHIDTAPIIDRYKIPGVVPYYPGRMSPDYIHRPVQINAPTYKEVNAFMHDCNCTRRVIVRVN